MNYRFATLLGVVLLAVPIAIAQGILPFSTQAGGPVSSIDLATSNIVLRIPVRNKIGKIPFSYSLVANSSPTGDASGPIILAGQLAGSGQVHYSLIVKVACEGGYSYTYGNFYYTDVTGASHTFDTTAYVTMGPTTACSGGNIDATGTDGTGYTLIASGGIGTNPTVAVYDKSGNNVTNGLITDPDGASITLSGGYEDTLGQTALTAAYHGGPSSDTYVYTDASGNNQTYTVAYTSLNVVYDLCGFAQGEPTPLSYPTSITTPAGNYTLSYTVPPGYGNTYTDGRIAKITLPSGGYESFTYAGGTNGEQCSSTVVPTLTHTINDSNGNSGMWKYVNSNTSATAGNFTVTETDPAGNQTIHSFAGEYQTQAVYYQGTSRVLKTVTTCYNGTSFSSCPSASVPTLPITETDVYTSLNASATNRVKTTFDSTYGNVTSVSRYDWGSILASVTAGSGGSSNGISYGKYVPGTGCVAVGNYINDRPCSVDVYDGSSNLYSQVSYTYNATGHATSVYNWVSGSNSLTSSAAYGGNGAAAGVLSSVTDANGAITSFGNFACNGILPGSTTYPLASVGSDSQSWDCNGGVVSTKTDVNGKVTSYTYDDPLYRLTQIQYPDSSSDTLKISYSTGTNFPWQIVETKAVTNSTSVSLYTNLDGLGRKMKTATSDPTYGYSYQDFVYNALGELYSVDAPYYTSAGTLCANGGCVTTYAYDALGRTISVTPPMSSDATAISYNNRASEVTHAGISKVSQVDGLGRTINVCEVTNATPAGGPSPSACGLDITPSPNDGFLSGLNYDALGRITSFCAGPSQCRNFAYDGLSRLTSESYPEVGNNTHTTNGTITYIYDALHAGDLYQRTAPLENQTGTATVVTTYTFDKMHRPTNISYNDGTTLAVGWAYDLSSYWGNTLSNGKGRVSFQSTSLNGGAADVIYGYDPMGNVNLYGQCSPQNCAVPNDFITSYTYNFVGEPAGGSTFVSGGPYWTNAYDAIGRLQSVWTSYLTNSSSGNLISGITYNALGERTGDSLANGLSESWSYDNEGRVNGYSAGSLYTYGLTYTPLITSSTDSINSNYSYTYDGLGRLSTAGNGTNNFSYGYDRWGNRWNQTATKGSGPQPHYSFNANNQSGSFTYDAAGNITNDGSHTYSYDAEGRVLKVDGGTTNTYVYNSRGMRAALAGAENLFDLNGDIVSVVTPGTATLAYNRYTVGGRLLAANLSGTTDFYHQDWLGGIRAGSSLSGSLIDSCTNLPFGDGTNNCGLWYFAGLMSDPWDSLNTSATRSQSPTSGRWLTPDPAGLTAVDPSNPQTWNRYAYVTNNPVSLIDPTGLDDCAYDACVTATYPTVPLEVLNIGGVPGGTGPGGGLIQVPGTTVNVRAAVPTDNPAQAATKYCQDHGQIAFNIPFTRIPVTLGLSTTGGPANFSSTNDLSAVVPVFPWPEWLAGGASLDITINAPGQPSPSWSVGVGKNLSIGGFITPQGSQGFNLSIGPSVGPPINVTLPGTNLCGKAVSNGASNGG